MRKAKSADQDLASQSDEFGSAKVSRFHSPWPLTTKGWCLCVLQSGNSQMLRLSDLALPI
jgi:hypothetical protein